MQQPTTPNALLEGLPPAYRVCPFITEYRIPGFSRYSDGAGFSFCPEPVAMDVWWSQFIANVQSAIGRRFLPVCRLADGEFKMLFWPVLRNPRLSRQQQVKGIVLTGLQAWTHLTAGFRANTAPDVSSGKFAWREWGPIRRRSKAAFLQIGREGVLALHLGVAAEPFQEEYFPAVLRWLRQGGLELTLDNYVPFYFVYALLRGPAGDFLFDSTRVLVVHSAIGDRRDRIISAISARGAKSVEWIPISSTRSFDAQIDVSRSAGHCDVCIVGAGVGKALVIGQLRPLGVPVIDAGFVFEAWADETRAASRPVMIPDP